MIKQFTGVEVVIKTNSNCDKLIGFFTNPDTHVVKLGCDTHKWVVYFAVAFGSSTDATIQAICRQIENLPRIVRKQWDDAAIREFFVGYEVATTPPFRHDHINAHTITMLTRIGAGIGIALYPSGLSDAEESRPVTPGKKK